MQFTCQKCAEQFEYTKGCNISYTGIRCKSCNDDDTKQALERAKLRDHKPYQFTPFFDQSLGIYIASYSQKKEIEKSEGVTYMSNDDRIAATKEAQRNINHKKYTNIKNNITQIYERCR